MRILSVEGQVFWAGPGTWGLSAGGKWGSLFVERVLA